MLWVLGWITLAAWNSSSGGLPGTLRTLGFGMAGLLSASVIYTLLRRLPLKLILYLTLTGLVPTILVSVWLGTAMPQLRTSTKLSGKPLDLTLAQLRLNRPDLPAHVQIQGYLIPELTLTGSYTVRQDRTYKTRYVSLLPLVEAGWESNDKIMVMVESSAYDYTEMDQNKITATGILYPVTPRPGERAWTSDPVGFDAGWYAENAAFNYQPAQLYILADESPGSLIFLSVLFSIFTLAFMGIVVYVAARFDTSQ